jgi:hypothetical protein
MPSVWSSQLAGALHGRLPFPSVALTQPETSSNAAKTPIHNNNRLIFICFQKKNNVFISSTWNATAAANARNETTMQMENTFMDYSSLPSLFVPE